MSLLERPLSWVLGERMLPPESAAGRLVPEGVVLRRGRLVPWIGGVMGRMRGPAAAVTLRRTIVLNPDAPLTPTLLAHELEHVRQWREDRLFPLRYTLATLRHGYRDNPYEKQARDAADALARTFTAEDLQ